MIERFASRGVLLLLGLSLVLPLHSARSDVVAAGANSSGCLTNTLQVIRPGPVDGQIASVMARMLQGNHYLRTKFDEQVSSKFFDRYLETLDSLHLYFTQGDLAEFEGYRTNLAHLTIDASRHGVADTTPACAIFNRFLQRVAQRVAYADELLQHEKFTFDADERITINRKDSPYPADLNEAKKLWRERLRFEYLQELLGKIGAHKKDLAAAGKKKPLGALTNALAQAGEAPKQTSTATTSASETQPVVAAGSHNSVLPSPKDAERAPLRPSAAERARAKAEAERKAHEEQVAALNARAAEVRARAEQEELRVEAAGSAAALTNPTAGPTPKKTEAEEIVETLSHRYHRNLRFFTDWNNDDVLQIYLTALAHVYDPHSDYFGHAQLEQFSIGMNLSLFGIGAELQSEDGYCKIRRLLTGGPAIKSKLIKVDDRIVAVAQGNQPPVDIVDMSLNKAVQLIRGPKGTEVRLTVIPVNADASTRTVVSLIRDEIPLEEQAAKAKLIEMPCGLTEPLRLGVIDLPSFYATFEASNSKDKPEPKSTTADVAKLLEKLKREKVAGVILDLRNNGGGSLEEAIKLAGLFIKAGPVVEVRETDGTVQEADDPDPSICYDGPLIVLTSRHSASASEIVAGALQDYGRALIVGDSSTHGKGTVQSVNQLRPYIRYSDRSNTNDPGALKLTIKQFFRPCGVSTQLKGVLADIVLPSVASASKDIGESALDNPLPQGQPIPSTKYDHFNLVEPYLPELRKRSAERIAADKEYEYVREDIELFKKHQEDKTISLNQEQRLKEQEDLEARQKARDKERLARLDPPEKVYELTLKLAALDGLPAPLARTNARMAAASSPVAPGIAVSGASTNGVAAAAVAPADDSLDEAEHPPAPDEPLVEAEHILMDYVSLLPKGNVATAGREPGQSPPP
jgi:carboxyl-terminal processing protease